MSQPAPDPPAVGPAAAAAPAAAQANGSHVRELHDLLASLRGELERSQNPHRQALRSLRVNEYGWTAALYSDEALRIWKDLARRAGPDRLEALQHLAIMHHARALDLEEGADPRAADADWEAAHKLWHELWRTDEFWATIAPRAGLASDGEEMTRLRREFALLFLKIHHDIALDPATKSYRARHHLTLAARSSFPSEAKQEVRRSAYERHLAPVPAKVWQMDELDPEVIKLGTDSIRQYLDLDPGYVPALSDALRLQARLLRAWYRDLQCEGKDSPRRGEILKRIAASGTAWREFFDQLQGVASELEEEVRERLALWYRVIGDVLVALDQEAVALEYFERGASAGPPDGEEVRVCRKRHGHNIAYLAMSKAAQEEADARAWCARAAALPDLSAQGLAFLANAYAHLSDFERAGQFCSRVLERAANFDATDPEATEEATRLRPQIEELRRKIEEARCLHAADAHMKAERWAEALQELDPAIARQPRRSVLHFKRCQCLIALNRLDDAKRALQAFESAPDKPPQAATVAQRLKQQIAAGGIEPLLEQAHERMQADEWAPAIRLLDQAFRQAPRDANVLFLQARCRLEMGEAAAAREKLRSFQQQARDNPQATAAAAKLDQDIRFVEERTAEYGSMEAFKLQQQAVEAWNAGQAERGIALLRQARERSPRSRKLKQELAHLLLQASMKVFNETVARNPARAKTQAIAYLQEARGLDPGNDDVATGLQTMNNLPI